VIAHCLIIDDQEDVLDALIPGLVGSLARQMIASTAFQEANRAAGSPLPESGRLNIKVTAHGYRSAKVEAYKYRTPVHVHLHLCCEKDGCFRHALRLLKEHLVAVVVSDLRYSNEVTGLRAGRLLIEEVSRGNPETLGILYSAYDKPVGFPSERFVRKGTSEEFDQLLAKMVHGFSQFLGHDGISRLTRELKQTGLVYQSDEFGSILKRLYDYAGVYFDEETPQDSGRRRPRPTLLIDGETGTGKTELTGLLHRISERRQHPFLTVDSSSLTNDSLLRSTLFGHVRGAFTDARDRVGMVTAVGKGILLLDDLHQLTDGGRAILHRFLDDGRYTRLGEEHLPPRCAEAAIVCTVETPAWEEIKAEKNLGDAFINRVERLVLRIPPLRNREEDLKYQAQVFCEHASESFGESMRLTAGALDALVELGFAGRNSRALNDFVCHLVQDNARVTQELDESHVAAHAGEAGWLPRLSQTSAVPVAAIPLPWPLGGQSVWARRISELAVRALMDAYGLDRPAAEQDCRVLFEERFPRLWEEFGSLIQCVDAARPMEIKLFDELLRYYAIYLLGNPADAARRLGMKDTTLREFVYSREQKRGPGGRG
jgi:DNA-binding NtrC family response regulator